MPLLIKTYKYFLTFIFCFLAINKIAAQDINFSQFYEQPLLRNPALAGVFEGDIRVKAIFRDQWYFLNTPFKTLGLSAEVKLPIKNASEDWVTLGTQFTQDKAGDASLKRTSFLPVINYHKQVGNGNYLSLAFMGGAVTSQFDPSKLTFDDQYVGGGYSPSNPTAQTFYNTSYMYWDASAGLSFTGNYNEEVKYYIGSAVYHFNNPKLGFYTVDNGNKLAPKYVVNAGLTAKTSTNNKVTFYADFFTQSTAQQFLGGVLYSTELEQRYDDEKTKNFAVGAFYRWNDAIIPVVNFDINDISFSVSYDINVSKLSTASKMQGGFEFSATFRSWLNKRSKYADAVRCVGF